VPQLNWSTIWRVFLGGALGTLLRVLVMLFVAGQLTVLVVVNLFGTAFLGYANGSQRFDSDNSSAFWKVGFSGGFTTMSGLALLVIPSQPISALVAAAMMALGVVVYLLTKRGRA
jgi:fluoride ion exporter CrcB/FEX